MKILTPNQANYITYVATVKLANYLEKNKIKTIVLGVSGGIDSAAVAAIGLRAIDLLGSRGISVGYDYVFIDVDSNTNDLLKAMDLEKYLGFRMKGLNLTEWYNDTPLSRLIPTEHPRTKIALGNIKCRLRMITLYQFAQLDNGIVMDTDDLSEELMGFWTRHGDEGDVKIIQQLTKDEVYDLSEFLGVPDSILKSQPGDGLGVSKNNLASDQLGLPYMVIDYIMSRFIQNRFNTNHSDDPQKPKFIELAQTVANEIGYSKDSILKIIEQCAKTSYKRRYGENVVNLLPNRDAIFLPDMGTDEFNDLYLKAIKSSK